MNAADLSADQFLTAHALSHRLILVILVLSVLENMLLAGILVWKFMVYPKFFKLLKWNEQAYQLSKASHDLQAQQQEILMRITTQVGEMFKRLQEKTEEVGRAAEAVKEIAFDSGQIPKITPPIHAELIIKKEDPARRPEGGK